MAKKDSLSSRLKNATQALKQAKYYGDKDSIEAAEASLSSVQAQVEAVKRKAAERGTIGTYSADLLPSSAEVVERRKRSAVVIGGVVQLPLVAASKRASPNYLLRSAVFAVHQKGHRATLMRVRVAAEAGYEVYFSGIQLDQADLDVWLHCLHLSRDCLGEQVEVGMLQFLRDIGRTEGAASQEWLRESLVRLGMATIQVKHKDNTVMLADRMVVYEERNQISKSTIGLRVSPSMAGLFGVARWTALDMKVRAQLVGRPLAQWLHAFLATHRKPLPLALAKLRELSGSRTAELRLFRRTLKQAVVHLVSAGFLLDWEITSDDCLLATRS